MHGPNPTRLDHLPTLDLHRFRVSVGTGSIAYVDEGTGPAIVLLHGAPMTSLAFFRLIHALRPHHRVIAPDLPGFGDSERSPAFDGSLAAYGEALDRSAHY